MSSYSQRSDYGFPLASPTSAPHHSLHNNSSGTAHEQSHGHSYSSHSDHAPPYSPSNGRPDSSQTGDDSVTVTSPTQESGLSSAPPRSVPMRKNSSNSHAVRKRTSRACDQCNQLRTKCDGKHPCSHCTETSLTCEYARMPKKRGKVSKKDLARQAALRDKTAETVLRQGVQTSAAVGTPGSLAGGQSRPAQTQFNGHQHQNGSASIGAISDPAGPQRSQMQPAGVQDVAFSNPSPASNTHSQRSGAALSRATQSLASDGQTMQSAMEGQYTGIDLNAFSGMPPAVDPSQGAHMADYRATAMDFSNLYMGMGGLPGQPLPLENMEFPVVNSPSAGTSMSGGLYSQTHIKHPVLLPLLPFLKNIMAPSLAYDLLEHFFMSSSPDDPHPSSPYHIAAIFRKQSFIGPQNPRRCSPALLASMLWSAAWTSDARALTSPPSARARMCQKLLNLCIFLLNPLIHGERLGKGAPDAERNGVSKAHPMGVQEMLIDDDVPVKISSGTVDDVATYMHIAIVISASEDKGASLRWWTAAWNLAKELRLGRELGHNARSMRPNSFFLNDEYTEPQSDDMNIDGPVSNPISEEEREERRRIWWTLYLVDRHLALCYNRHLTILDSECVGLLRPMDERAWQEGIFEPLDSTYTWNNPRTAGRFEFTGPSIFGYFLPLSTILGEIVDLHQRRMHPLLQGTNTNRDLSGYDAEIRAICTHQLETFEKSMVLYHDRHTPAGQQSGVGPGSATGSLTDRGAVAGSGASSRPQLTEAQFQIATACAYGTHLMHVLYILLNDRWDPVSLLDDDDLWISTPAFQTAMGHAVAGADALGDVLKYDPELGFMPYLFGIYLLQGSFLLLLTADKLGTEANDKTVSACETVVRGTEACVVTLNTEYQVSQHLLFSSFSSVAFLLSCLPNAVCSVSDLPEPVGSSYRVHAQLTAFLL